MADRPLHGGARGNPVEGWFAGPAAWPTAGALLWIRLRRWALAIIALGVIFGGLGAFAKLLLPQSYMSTAQVLIDPRGVQVFANDLTSGQFDANAAVNYVESQMQIMQSERILARAIRDANLDGNAPPPAALRTSLDTAAPPPAVLARIASALTITRSERSYIIDVTARAATPEQAALIANAVVKAYIDEDGASRASATDKLTANLTARLDQLPSGQA